ncbi:MAG: non-homologous end-joining DNA ligase [Puniceicoccaceae bacterium]
MHEIFSQLTEAERERLKQTDQPDFVQPMRATLVHEHFSDPGWIYERKLDGERCLLRKKGDEVTLHSRNEIRKNRTYPEIAEALARLSGNFILDSEIVTFEGGLTSFKRLQNRTHTRDPEPSLMRKVPVHAYVFDLLYFEDRDLRRLPLRRRKNLLRRALGFRDPIRFLPHRNEHGEDYLAEACGKGWEGLIAKEADSAYVSSRSKKWLKFKCGRRQELVIGGFTDPEGERVGFGALLLGYFEEDDFHYAGRVGTGFDNAFLESFREQLDRIEQEGTPFVDFDSDDKTIHWAKPQYVGEIGFTEWTNDNRLRHPRFLGLRDDKVPREVGKEQPS